MTTAAADSSAYVAAIEQCFVAIRGRGVLWAPEDAARALRWHAAGAPLGTVVRVLDARVRAWRFQHGEHARLPMHLGWYEVAILQALKPLTTHIARANADAPAEASPGPTTLAASSQPLLAELLDPLPALIAATSHLALQHAYRKAYAQLDSLQRPEHADGDCDPETLRDPQTAIRRCRNQLHKTVVLGLADDEAAALHRHLEAARSQLAGRLSRKAQQARLEIVQEGWLAAHIGLKVPTAAGWIDPRDDQGEEPL